MLKRIEKARTQRFVRGVDSTTLPGSHGIRRELSQQAHAIFVRPETEDVNAPVTVLLARPASHQKRTRATPAAMPPATTRTVTGSSKVPTPGRGGVDSCQLSKRGRYRSRPASSLARKFRKQTTHTPRRTSRTLELRGLKTQFQAVSIWPPGSRCWESQPALRGVGLLPTFLAWIEKLARFVLCWYIYPYE